MICHARILRERIRVWTRRIRLVRKSEFSDRMHEDRSAGFDQPPSTERANKPWIGFLPALHYPSIYWWHYVMVSIIQPWTWDRGLLWLTLSFFIYITAKPVGYIYPKEISINTVKFLYQTIAHLDSSSQPRARMHNWADSRCTQIRSCTAVCMRSLRLSFRCWIYTIYWYCILWRFCISTDALFWRTACIWRRIYCFVVSI